MPDPFPSFLWPPPVRASSHAGPQTLLAREVVAVNQDPLGAQGRPVWPSGSGSEGGVEVWVKPLADGRTAVLLVNLGEETVDVTTEFAWVRGKGQAGEPGCADGQESTAPAVCVSDVGLLRNVRQGFGQCPICCNPRALYVVADDFALTCS